MDEINVDVWLYGDLAEFGGQARKPSHANLVVSLAAGATLGQLIEFLGMPAERRGITFINGEVSALPGFQPDLPHVLHNGDRVAFFHLRSMWPFQYRHGVAMIPEMSRAMQERPDSLHHHYGEQEAGAEAEETKE